MCVIVAKPKDVEIDLKTLEQCWEYNPHGAGIAYALNGKVFIEKGLMTWEDFQIAFASADIWTDLAALFHFRIRTHGDTDEANTHPFEVVPGKLAFAHNGVMSGMTRTSRPDLSDTQVFNRYILQQLPHNFLRNSGMTALIENMIGGRNKLAFLDGSGKITIINERAGTRKDSGLWFSNLLHEPRSSGYVWTGNARSGASYGTGPRYQSSYLKGSTPAPRTSYPQSNMYSWMNRKEMEAEEEETATVITVDEDKDDGISFYDEEWYCHDCAVWFDEWEEFEDIGCLSANWGGGVPDCPGCGSNAKVAWGFSETIEELVNREKFQSN